MFKSYGFGPIKCAFAENFARSPWSMWNWKIDAYESPSDEGASCASLIISEAAPGTEYTLTEKIADERSGFYSRQIFRQPDNGTLWRFVETRSQEVALAYKMSANWDRIELIEDNTDSAGSAAFEYLSRMVIYSAIRKGVVTFHGALLEHDGKGIIISAPSGTGKTTHARLWRDNLNSLIINGDNACTYITDGKRTGFGIPWCGTSGENINREVPISALVILEQSEVNEAEKLSGYEAFTEALPVLQCPAWDKETSELALDGMESFLSDVPVFRLKCRPDSDAVLTLKKALG